MTDVKVPTLGESITEATIGEWLKQPGDAVAADEPIASLETDKVAVDVPAPVAGVMGAQQSAVGDTVAVGDLELVSLCHNRSRTRTRSHASDVAKGWPLPDQCERKVAGV